MDKMLDALGQALSKLDPRTAIVIITLFLIVGGLVWIIKKLIRAYKEKDSEVSDLHKVNKADNSANMLLLADYKKSLEALVEHGELNREVLTKIYENVITLKSTLESLIKD